VAPDVVGSNPTSRPIAIVGSVLYFTRIGHFCDANFPPARRPPSLKAILQAASVCPQNAWLQPFVPRHGLRNADLQTLVAAFRPRRIRLPAPEDVLVAVDTATSSRVLCRCHWQPVPVRAQRLTLLLVHGLEGSSESQYMLGNASRAWHAGWNVIRMNMRNCGGTEALTPTLYHSGLSGDVQAVSGFFARREGLRQIAWAGYSMGGNLVLKAAGEYAAEAPAWLTAVAGVSPAIDLAASADALHQPRNRLYELNFLRNMIARYRRKAELFPDQYSLANLPRVKSIQSYDEYIVAPNCGFSSADDYYFRCAAARVIDAIRVPTLILHSLDDPFIRLTPETRKHLLANPAINLVETAHGGHCGFLAPATPQDDGYWAESTLAAFFAYHAGRQTAEFQ
jgi:predicted alpha/beta-fold hydrolase